MGYLNQFPNTNFYDQDLGFLVKSYKELTTSVEDIEKKYDLLEKIYETIQQDITNITKEQLETMLNDGTLENIIENIMKENVDYDIVTGLKKTKNIPVCVPNPSLVVECARTYLYNSDKFTYGAPSFLTTIYNSETDKMENISSFPVENGKFKISCSTLVLACINGLDYNHTRCANGTISNGKVTGGQNIYGSGATIFNLYDKNILDYREEGDTFIYASGVGHMLYDRGLLHEIDLSRISNLCVGDILFYKSKEISPNDWENLHHCEIFVGFGRLKDTYTVISVTSSGSVEIINRKFTDRYAEQLAYHARLPYVASTITPTDMLDGVVRPIELTTNVGTSTGRVWYKLNGGKRFARYRPYIVTVKMPSYSGNNFRLSVNLVANDSSVSTSYNAQINPTSQCNYLGNNCYYTVIYVLDSGTDLPYLMVYPYADNGIAECSITDISVLEFTSIPKIM